MRTTRSTSASSFSSFARCAAARTACRCARVDCSESLNSRGNHGSASLLQAARGELEFEGLKDLAGSIDVAEAGVGGAKGFFEAQAAKQNQANKFVCDTCALASDSLLRRVKARACPYPATLLFEYPAPHHPIHTRQYFLAALPLPAYSICSAVFVIARQTDPSLVCHTSSRGVRRDAGG